MTQGDSRSLASRPMALQPSCCRCCLARCLEQAWQRAECQRWDVSRLNPDTLARQTARWLWQWQWHCRQGWREYRRCRAAHAAARRLSAPSDTHDAKLSCGALSQTANGESKTCTRNKTGWRSSLRRRATIVAQHIAMAVPHVDLNTSCCRTAGSTVRRDAKPTCTALRHTANGESE